VKREEKRHALRSEEEQTAWLRRKADAGGFAVLSVTASREGSRAARKTDYNAPEPKEHRISLFAVRFDGVLKVTDDEAFLRSLCCGIGSAKGLGFGLLSLARAEQWTT
jgi:CRISPR system Cascade subunit CasE